MVIVRFAFLKWVSMVGNDFLKCIFILTEQSKEEHISQFPLKIQCLIIFIHRRTQLTGRTDLHKTNLLIQNVERQKAECIMPLQSS